jgi:hypothetical protein
MVIAFLSLEACSTSELLVENARRRTDFAPVVAFRTATLLEDRLFVRLELGSGSAQAAPREYVVELSLDRAAWAGEEAATFLGVQNHLPLVEDFRLRVVPTGFLRPAEEWPQEGTAVEIRRLDQGTWDGCARF